MLAPTFASAKTLHISEIERQVAIRVLENLESGFYQQADFHGPFNYVNGFNMNYWFEKVDVDSRGVCYLGCVGGWMEREKGYELSNNIHDKWDHLFHPPFLNARTSSFFTMERVARALRTKLETGARQCWDYDEIRDKCEKLYVEGQREADLTRLARRREAQQQAELESRRAREAREFDEAYEEATWENAWRAVGNPPWSRDVLGRPVPFYGAPPFVARAR